MGARSSTRLFLSGLLSLLVLLFPAGTRSAEDSAVSLYKKYLEESQRAVESESKGDHLAALQNYRSALEWLESTAAAYPDWFPEIVGSRVAECESNIERLGGEIEKGTGSGMEISPELASEAMGKKKTATEMVFSGLGEEICRRADALYEKGRYAEAAREYEMVLKLDPDNPRANFQLGFIYSEHIRDKEKMEKFWGRYRAVVYSDMGDIYSKDGRYLTAIEQYGEALRAAPGNTSIRRRLADIYFKQMRYPEAREEYRAVLSEEPGDLYSRFQLARIHAEQGAEEKAVSELDYIRERSADYPGLKELYARLSTRTGDTKGAIDWYEKVLGDEPGDVGPYLELARLYGEEGRDPESAVEILARGLARFPESSRLAREMGRVCVRLGDYRKARETYEGLLEKTPGDVDSLVGLGIVSLKEGDGERAETYFEKALEVEPDSPSVLFQMACCLESRGDRTGAIDCLEKAVEGGAAEAVVFRKLVDMYVAAGQADRAEATLERAIRRWPGASDMRKSLIELHIAAGRKDAAIGELERYVKQEDRDAAAFLRLGDLYYEKGKEGEALRAYKEALRLEPGTKGLSKKIAALHQRRGEYGPAIEALRGAIEEEPDSPVLHNNIAVCYAKRRMFLKAVEEYEKALALDGDFAEVHIDLAKIYGEALGEPEKAIEHSLKYLELRPEGEHVSLVKEMLMSRKEARGGGGSD